MAPNNFQAFKRKLFNNGNTYLGYESLRKLEADKTDEEFKELLDYAVKCNYLVVIKDKYAWTGKMARLYRNSTAFKNQRYKKDNVFSWFILLATLIGIIVGAYALISSYSTAELKDNEEFNELIDSLKINYQLALTKLQNNKIDSTNSLPNASQINQKVALLEKDVVKINQLISSDPKRIIDVASINRDIQELRSLIAKDSESYRREMDRISTYNNTLIVFMIAFLGVIGAWITTKR